MSTGLRRGNNSEITIDGDSIQKLSRFTFRPETATRLVANLEGYIAAFKNEPVHIPTVESIEIIDAAAGRQRVQYTSKLCTGPNLCSVPAGDKQESTRIVLAQLANMSTLDNKGTLALPLDAFANNFHMSPEGGVMVDLFPPLLRNPDGSMPLQNIQHSQPKSRQKIIPYTRGTREGAVLATLFTSVAGDHPFPQGRYIARGIDDWCYDVLPTELPDVERDNIRKQLDQRFVPYFALSALSGAISETRRQLGIHPYPHDK